MNTKTMKILTFVATLLLILLIGSTVVYGIAPGDIKPADPKGNDIQDIGGKILGILQAVGVVIAVIIIVVIGIKYVMGSAEERAEYKKTMMPYIIGAVLVFAGPTIANVLYNVISGAN